MQKQDLSYNLSFYFNNSKYWTKWIIFFFLCFLLNIFSPFSFYYLALNFDLFEY